MKVVANPAIRTKAAGAADWRTVLDGEVGGVNNIAAVFFGCGVKNF